MEFLQKVIESIDYASLITTSFRITFILFIAWLLSFLLKRTLVKLELIWVGRASNQGESSSEAKKRIETIVRLLKQTGLIALWVTMALVIFREVGLEIGPILASAGILGLAIGFGAQNLVRDFIAGFFMILENQIRVGDVAIINSTGGLVEQINFRTTVLRDLQGVVHYFQNGKISSLSNMTNDWSAYVFDIGVAYKENTDDVAIKIQQVIDSMMSDDKFKNLIVEQPEIFGVDKLDNSAVVIKGRIKTLPIQQWIVGREFLRRIKFAFDEANIEIPFPHSTIYFGEDSKPFDVAMMQSKSEINLDAPVKTNSNASPE
jgi:small-conductance mechanosensitive channel